MIENSQKRNMTEILSSILIAGAASLIFLQQSPLHPWIRAEAATDSSVYKTVSLMMEKGYTPYLDSFDHKGPMIFVINRIGDFFSPYCGVWVVEAAFLFVSLIMIYKTARLFCRPLSGLVVSFLSVSPLFVYFQGGNLCEEYAMSFIAASLFIFLDYLKNNNKSPWRIIICGLCFGGTLLIKPNLTALWIVMCLGIAIEVIIRKNWKDLKYFILFFCIGLACICIPFIIWLSVRGALAQFWNDCVLFNREYVSDFDGYASFSGKWNTFISFVKNPFIFTALLLALFNLTGEEKKVSLLWLLSMLVSLLFTCMAGRVYLHYGMILVPLLAYPFATALEELEKLELKQGNSFFRRIVLVAACTLLFVTNWAGLICSLPDNFKNRNADNVSAETSRIVDYIDRNTKPDDRISVYGNWDIIYVLSDRAHATRYSYQYPVADVAQKIFEEYTSQLKEEQPEVVVVQAGKWDGLIAGFLKENNYEMAVPEGAETADHAMLFIRKQK